MTTRREKAWAPEVLPRLATPSHPAPEREERRWEAFECAHGHRFQIDAVSASGRVVKCPACGTVTVTRVVIPEQEAEQLREALRQAADDLGKAANQFAGLGHELNAEWVAEHGAKARVALKEKGKLDG